MTKRDNYRPVSILSNLPKVFERYLRKQISPFLDDTFSKYQYDFIKGHSTQHGLLALTVEK